MPMLKPYAILYTSIYTFACLCLQAELLKVTDAMSTAGVVMRFRNVVYLRPRDVARVVMQVRTESHLSPPSVSTYLKAKKLNCLLLSILLPSLLPPFVYSPFLLVSPSHQVLPESHLSDLEIDTAIKQVKQELAPLEVRERRGGRRRKERGV